MKGINMISIKGKTVLVTGASSGIGYELAKYLAKLGANIVITARRYAQLDKLREEILRDYNVRVEIIIADLNQRETPELIFNQLKTENINIDILINNAGIGWHNYFHTSSWDKNQSLMDLLMLNLVHMTHLILPGMRERNYGYILNVSSTATFQPAPTYALYAAAKSFVFSFTLAIGQELKNSNINVKCTVLCPGVTITEFFKTAKHGEQSSFIKMSQMTAAKVAKIGINNLLKGNNYIVPGFVNKLNCFFARHLPRSVITQIAGSAMGEPLEK